MFHVGYFDYQTGMWRNLASFPAALQAVRVARKMEDKAAKHDGQFPELSVTVAIIGSTFFELNWRRYASVENRQFFKRLQTYLETLEAISS